MIKKTTKNKNDSMIKPNNFGYSFFAHFLCLVVGIKIEFGFLIYFFCWPTKKIHFRTWTMALA